MNVVSLVPHPRPVASAASSQGFTERVEVGMAIGDLTLSFPKIASRLYSRRALQSELENSQ
jgi:hypothetical protein